MARKPVEGAPTPEPWKPVRYEIADAAAIQALARGDANADQQRRALGFIIENASCTYDMAFRPGPDGARSTDFAEGRRFVGNTLVKLTKINLAKLGKTITEQG